MIYERDQMDKTMKAVETFTLKYAMHLSAAERQKFVKDLGELVMTATREAQEYVEGA
jgi:hypothetical protein